MSLFKVFSDGASRGNPGPAGIGTVIYDDQGEKVLEVADYIGIKTNNVAEYQALIRGLEEVKKLGATEVEVFADSELMVKQMRGEYKVKNEGLQPLYQKAKLLSLQLTKFKISYVPREKNKEADKLANLGIDKKSVVTTAFKMPKSSPLQVDGEVLNQVIAKGELLSLEKITILKGEFRIAKDCEHILYVVAGQIFVKGNDAEFTLEAGKAYALKKSREVILAASEAAEVLHFSLAEKDEITIV